MVEPCRLCAAKTCRIQ